MFKAYLFDIDGVLIRHEEYFSRSLTNTGYPSASEIMDKFYGSTLNQECDRGYLDPLVEVLPYLRQFGWTEGSRAYFDRQYEFESKFIDFDLLKMIDRLREGSARCYIASNQNYYRKEFLVRRMKLEYFFDQCFFSSEIGSIKPEQEYWERVFLLLNEQAGEIHPNETLFLDDLEENIQSALAFGMNAVRIDSKSDILEAISSGK